LSFIGIASQRGARPNGFKVEWRPDASSESFEDGVYVAFDKNEKFPFLSLFDIPVSMRRDFLVTDLMFPVPISGFVVIVNTWILVEGVKSLREEGKIRRPATPAINDLAWAISHNLPIVIAAVYAKKINRDIDKLSELLTLPINMPVVWCDGEMDKSFTDRVLQTIYEEIEK
jgi:hypothetical protein